jgi:hypothetical protein
MLARIMRKSAGSEGFPLTYCQEVCQTTAEAARVYSASCWIIIQDKEALLVRAFKLIISS